MRADRSTIRLAYARYFASLVSRAVRPRGNKDTAIHAKRLRSISYANAIIGAATIAFLMLPETKRTSLITGD